MTQPDPAPRGHSEPTPTGPKQAAFLQAAGAVFWGFFGVRKGRHMQQDTTTIKPHHVIIVGLIGGALFVLTLIALVSFITRGT